MVALCIDLPVDKAVFTVFLGKDKWPSQFLVKDKEHLLFSI